MIKVPTEIIVELKKIQKRFIWSTKPKTTQYLPISKKRVLKMRMHHFRGVLGFLSPPISS